MIISVEILRNPGPNALFVAEVKLEKSAAITSNVSNWWGLWFGWWLFPARLWKHWLYGWERTNDGGWFTWQVRLLGFEINWQRRKYLS